MNMLTDKTVSVVVACYRDAGSVREMLRRLTDVLSRLTPNWEIVYVNDDSPDDAEPVLLECAREEPRLTVISHSRNFGAQTAFTTGMAQAVGDAVIIMDGDLQDPPELVEEFVKTWLAGSQVVYGIRAKRREVWYKNIFYKTFYRMLRRISYIDIPLDAGEFSLMDRCVVDVILAMPERDRLVRGLRAWAGFKQTGIAFERPERYAGESTQSFFNYIYWAIKSFTSYSFVPLRLILWTGITISFLLFLAIVVYLAAYALGAYSPSGYITLLMFILGIGAVQIFCLGILGEYVARMFEEIKARPHQVLRTLVNDHRDRPRPWLGTPGPPPELKGPSGGGEEAATTATEEEGT